MTRRQTSSFGAIARFVVVAAACAAAASLWAQARPETGLLPDAQAVHDGLCLLLPPAAAATRQDQGS